MTNLTLKYQHNNIARIFHINRKLLQELLMGDKNVQYFSHASGLEGL
jgi:hypothetical protein